MGIPIDILFFLDSICCFCGASEASEAYSESFGFGRILCSNFLDLFCSFCGASEASAAHSESFRFVRILGLFEVWVCSNVFGLACFCGDHLETFGLVRSLGSFKILDLGCCFCRASEVSGAYSETFEFANSGFVRIFGFGLLFLRSERSEWRPLSFEFWVCWVYLRICGLLACFGFGLSRPYLTWKISFFFVLILNMLFASISSNIRNQRDKTGRYTKFCNSFAVFKFCT